MATTLTNPATAPVDVACTCGGFLRETTTGGHEHVDTCAELHAPDADCPDGRVTHHSCTQPDPVPCAHPHRHPTASTLTGPPCPQDLPCCGEHHEVDR